MNLGGGAHSTFHADDRRSPTLLPGALAALVAGAGAADAAGGARAHGAAGPRAGRARGRARVADHQVQHAHHRDRAAGGRNARGGAAARRDGPARADPAAAAARGARAASEARSGPCGGRALARSRARGHCGQGSRNTRPGGAGCSRFRSSTRARAARQRGRHPTRHTGQRARHRRRRSARHDGRHPVAAHPGLGHARFRGHGPDRRLAAARRVWRAGVAAGRHPLRRPADAQGRLLHLAELAQHWGDRPLGAGARALFREPQGRGGLAFRARPRRGGCSATTRRPCRSSPARRTA